MKKLNGKIWKEMLISGANNMINNTVRIDALNVFPVPDGDTGSNMGATADNAKIEIMKLSDKEDISKVSAVFSRGMLLGARGNSGVILSQIFKGFSVGLENKKEAGVFDIVKAFSYAKEYAYKSVMKPVEGTILTVIRMIHEKLEKTITPSNTMETLFNKIIKFAKEAVEITPNLLPILKEVGVVDSGGEGLFLIFEGMAKALKGENIIIDKTQVYQETSFLPLENDDHSGEFGYCTEFIVELQSKKVFNREKFVKGLEKLADSIVVVVDEEILKVHGHTKQPGTMLNYAQKFGEFIKIKSENMTLQANESSSATQTIPLNKEFKEIGIVSVHVGQGIIDESKELGADFVIAGGQTMNPSAQDFINAFESMNVNKVIVLPNNSNVILAAQQASKTFTTKEVVIVPSKTQMQGLVALMHFNKDEDIDNNKKEMDEAIKEVKTAQITRASKTTKIKGVQIKEGEFLAIAENSILLSSKSKTKAAIATIKSLINDDTEVITIYFGSDATTSDAGEIASYIETHHSCDVEIKDGKQPIYDFLIAFE